MRRALRALLRTPLRLIRPERMARMLARVTAAYARGRPPREAARFLMDLDARLYPLQGEMAVAYGGGLHTKHRHMGYHDFFVAHIAEGETVLDIGCGVGALAHDVASRTGARVTGIDFSEGNIAVARKRHGHPNLSYIVGDALRDLPPGQFDVIILSNVLEHIESRVDFLRRIQAGARPRRWLIRVPVFERDWRVPLKRELGVEWRLDPTHFTEYTPEFFAQEMTEAGLRVIHQEVRWGEIWSELTADEP